jgi:hypothetical protein
LTFGLFGFSISSNIFGLNLDWLKTSKTKVFCFHVFQPGNEIFGPKKREKVTK